MSDFSKKTTTIKGTTGEDLCTKWLEDRGHTVYRVATQNRPHPIDSILMHGQKYTLACAEFKTKPKRDSYPDTGINTSHYGKYKCIQIANDLQVFVFFIDENEQRIYGNWLNKLDERQIIIHNGKKLLYPKFEGPQVYFPMVHMIHIGAIPVEEVNKLKSMRNSSYTAKVDLKAISLPFEAYP
jgi:hypothetical protein